MLTVFSRRLAVRSRPQRQLRGIGLALIASLAIGCHASGAAHATTVNPGQSIAVDYNFNPITAVPAGGSVYVQVWITGKLLGASGIGANPDLVSLGAAFTDGAGVLAESGTFTREVFPSVFQYQGTWQYTTKNFTGEFLLSALGASVADIRTINLQMSVYNSRFRTVGFKSLTFDEDDFTVVGQTPIPAALPLLASVLGVAGFVGWRRKRRQVMAMQVS
jgi:hypothetical protein